MLHRLVHFLIVIVEVLLGALMHVLLGVHANNFGAWLLQHTLGFDRSCAHVHLILSEPSHSDGLDEATVVFVCDIAV